MRRCALESELLEQIAERDVVRDGERHERADGHVHRAGLDPAHVDRVHADRLRRLRLRELFLCTEDTKTLAKAPPLPPGRGDEGRPVSCLRASVPEP